jgi:hypothetical protein
MLTSKKSYAIDINVNCWYPFIIISSMFSEILHKSILLILEIIFFLEIIDLHLLTGFYFHKGVVEAQKGRFSEV